MENSERDGNTRPPDLPSEKSVFRSYLVYVDEIVPMDADRLECARVGGWNCVVGKGEFKKGDIGVYFEIDSKLPEVVPFSEMEFLKSKHYAIKSQKRGQQRMRWLDGITNSMDKGSSKLWEMMKDREASDAGSERVGHDFATELY